MLGPHQSPFIFAWINSINSITRNYGIWFLLILKRFFFKKKNRGDVRIARQKKKWPQKFIENGIFDT